MTRFSNHLLSLSLLLPGCFVSHHDQPFVVDASTQDDAGAPDAARSADAVQPNHVTAQAAMGGAARAEGTSARVADAVGADVEQATREPSAVGESATGTAAPAQVAGAVEIAEAQPEREAVALDATQWQREVVPASLAGVDTKPYDPNFAGTDTCRGVMSEGQLCTCLSGPTDPESADYYNATCSHHALGVPGFGVFTDRQYTTYVTAQKDGGWYKLAYVDSAGFSSFSTSGGRLMRAGTLSVLAIEMQNSSGCTNDSWDHEEVQLCALRDLDSAQFGRCVSVPVYSLSSTWIPDTDTTVETRSRLSFRLTSRGTVVVRAKGKIRHDHVKKSLGEHNL